MSTWYLQGTQVWFLASTLWLTVCNSNSETWHLQAWARSKHVHGTHLYMNVKQQTPKIKRIIFKIKNKKRLNSGLRKWLVLQGWRLKSHLQHPRKRLGLAAENLYIHSFTHSLNSHCTLIKGIHRHRSPNLSPAWWHMPLNPTTKEAESGRSFQVQGQLGLEML